MRLKDAGIRALLTNKTEQYISGNKSISKRWRDVQQQPLVLPSQCQGMPARRLCGIHASAAIETALAHGWIGAEEQVQVPAAWASEDFDRSQMEMYLNDQVVLTDASSIPVSGTPADS